MILSAILLAFAAFLGLVMELYKKSLRRDRASENEIKLVALACSAAPRIRNLPNSTGNRHRLES